MPNHVTNRLTILEDGTTLPSSVLDPYLSEGGRKSSLDFDKIIPCPQIIKNVGQLDSIQIKKIKQILQLGQPVKDEEPDFIKNAVIAVNQTGFMYRYDWNCGNWGTKWNSYDFIQEPSYVKFDTAWSAPHPVILKLFTLLRKDIKHEWADEDTGSNVGYVFYKSSLLPPPGVEVTITEENFNKYALVTVLDGTKLGYKLGFELRGDREDWEWDEAAKIYRIKDED